MSKLNTKKLVIIGAGGFAREVAWLVSDINKANTPQWELVGFWDNEVGNIGKTLNGIPIIGDEDVNKHLSDLFAVVAIGNPGIKKRAVQQAISAGCMFATLIHPTTYFDETSVNIGSGSIICAGNILTVNINIGKHVILNLDCTVGHDSVIEDYVTISPGCHLSGHTTLRKGSFFGTGAVIIENREVGEDSVIGAGSVVVRDIPASVTAMGIPAKVKGD